MGTLLDGQVGFKKETTFGTGVTVDRFPEVLADSTHKPDAMFIQGMGLRVSSQFPRGARRLAGRGKGDLTLKLELQSKGLGTLLELLCGSSTSTNVSGATYQQLHTTTMTGTVLPSATIQFGTPRADSSGTVVAHTYTGCVAKSFKIEFPTDGIPTLEVNFWASSYASSQNSGTALASASYATTPTQFSTVAAVTTLGGALTVATTTALASGGTSDTTIRSWSFEVDNGINERPRLGGWQVPTVGQRSAKLTIAQDSTAATLETAFMAQTGTSFTGYCTGAALSTGTERFEVDIPQMFVTDHDFAQLTTGDGPVPSITFDVTDNLTDKPWYVVTRTADTAL